VGPRFTVWCDLGMLSVCTDMLACDSSVAENNCVPECDAVTMNDVPDELKR